MDAHHPARMFGVTRAGKYRLEAASRPDWDAKLNRRSRLLDRFGTY